MARTISRKDIPLGARDFFDSLHETGMPVIIEEGGEPVAVVMNPEEYERSLRSERERLWEMIERVKDRNADKDPDEMQRDIDRAVEEVRREQDAERRTA
jgi:PHD/YefM family antitoxin component YafN of YafNO toxin-antitoxin module